MPSRQIVLITAALCVSCTEESTSLVTGGGTTVDDLVALVEEGDDEAFVAALNEIKQSDPDLEVLRFLGALWSRDVAGYGLPNDGIAGDVPRIELADVLAQASRNGLIEVNQDELHQFIVARLESSLPNDAKRIAISALAGFDDPRDVELIERSAQDSSDAVFRSSVIGLAGMCSKEAEQALDRLEPTLEVERAEFVSETRRRFADFKESSAYCP